jgi:hypothetical protein
MLARITVHLPADLINRTKAAAALRGDTLSGIVRSRLEDYVRETQAKLQVADAADWQRLGIEQFFAGYAESDAVYDSL